MQWDIMLCYMLGWRLQLVMDALLLATVVVLLGFVMFGKSLVQMVECGEKRWKKGKEKIDLTDKVM